MKTEESKPLPPEILIRPDDEYQLISDPNYNWEIILMFFIIGIVLSAVVYAFREIFYGS